jgi:probable rRNA maturation factor
MPKNEYICDCSVVHTERVERAKEQAAEIGNTFHREVAFLAIHSTLHLLGYDHERSPEEDEIQCKRQKEIIEKLEF